MNVAHKSKTFAGKPQSDFNLLQVVNEAWQKTEITGVSEKEYKKRFIEELKKFDI
jgi:hypothetical protein